MLSVLLAILIEAAKLTTGLVNQLPTNEQEQKTEAAWNVECGCFEDRKQVTGVLGIRN